MFKNLGLLWINHRKKINPAGDTKIPIAIEITTTSTAALSTNLETTTTSTDREATERTIASGERDRTSHGMSERGVEREYWMLI